MKNWMEKEHSLWVYYDDVDGKIIGTVYRIGTGGASIWGGKIYDHLKEGVLGQFIDSDYARKAVERFWSIQERTLEMGKPPSE